MAKNAWQQAWAAVAVGILWLLLAGASLAEPAAVADATKTPKTKADTASAEPDFGTDWVRILKDNDGDVIGMQTAIVRYVPAKRIATASPSQVDLIGAVHIGDAAYYRELNGRFTKYDALLYELVAPEGTVVERGRGTSNLHPIGALQNGIKVLLELEHQLEQVDYTKPNFVHADMSPAQFAEAMAERNESFLTMYFRLLGQSLALQSEMAAKGESLDMDLFSALFATDRPRRLKIAMAKQLANMESLMVSFGGEQGSVIITERNKAALKVLKEQLAAGKKRIGIFYGAGHLNDMNERLREDFDLKPVSITWLTAWNLRPQH
jgi:hypothetical protein